MNVNFDVSMVIVNWNTCDILRECLKSIYDQKCKYSFEVIVVDNASIDGSVEMVESDFPEAILLKNIENTGFARAGNQGIRDAGGHYVLLMNSDVIVFHNTVSKLVEFAERNPDGAVFGCRILGLDRSLQQTCFMFPSIINLFLWGTYLHRLFPKNSFFGRQDMTWWDANDEREVNVVKGCFMLVRQEQIKQVGLLDEQFFMFAEEADWCYRFRKAGFKIMYTPSTEVIHIGGASTQRRKLLMKLHLYMGTLLFIRKHKGHLEFLAACFLLSVFLILRIPFWLMRLSLSKTRS